MSAPRFFASGGDVFETIKPGLVVVRDPIELRARVETWMRDGLEAQERGLLSLARVYGRDALQANLALALWEAQRRAAGQEHPFAEHAA